MSLYFQALDAPFPRVCRHGAVTLGNFDGVHLGHQALLAETTRQSRELAGPALAVTFDPHPQRLLHPETFEPTLTTIEHRAELVERHGATHVLVLRVTPSFLQLSATDFFNKILRDGLGARALVEGFNFGFGRKREGTPGLLQELGKTAGMRVTLIPALNLDGKPVSTSRVRTELSTGNVACARTLLGRPYRLIGTVAPGQKRGQTLGFPTANLQHVTTLVPRGGVYAVQVLQDGRIWPGAANLGPNPTFGEPAVKIEVHLIGFQGDLYGQTLMVDFHARLRDTRAFAGPADLVEQLQRDVKQAQRVAGSS
jgi:riboflavin kinase/FMN adenylyltransferase